MATRIDSFSNALAHRLPDDAVRRRARPRRAIADDDRAATLSAVTSIRRLVRVLRVAAHRTHATAGISAAQLFVLQQLGPGAGLSLNELAARTFTDRSSVAAVVDRLHSDGLVDRAVDPTDRRRAAVRITAKGRRVLDGAEDAPTTKLIAALRTLSPRQRATLAASLRRLTVALGAGEDPAPMLFADETKPRRALPP
jgi:DNA-binding MarR family transcriptional regulator